MRQDLDKKPIMPTDRKVPELGNLEQLPFKVRQSQEFSVLCNRSDDVDLSCCARISHANVDASKKNLS